MENSPTKARNLVENTIVDEANRRTYVVLAPRLLSDGEIYKAIRQEILRRGGKPVAPGATLTLTLGASGDKVAAGQVTPSNPPGNSDQEGLATDPGTLG